jgi:hypothetical protein
MRAPITASLFIILIRLIAYSAGLIIMARWHNSSKERKASRGGIA